jgi:two-component system nitrogen regulation sensor histidine kinase GlnL
MSESVTTENLLDNLSTAVLVLDSKLIVQYANHAAQDVFERSLNLLIGCPFNQFIASSSLDFERFKNSVQPGDVYSDSEVTFRFTDGRHTQADVSVTNIFENQDKRLLVEIRLVEQQKKLAKKIANGRNSLLPGSWCVGWPMKLKIHWAVSEGQHNC